MLRELLTYFGFEVDTKPLEKGYDKLEDFERQINKVAAGVGGALIARGLYRFTDALIDTGNQLQKNSEKFGISADEFAQWEFAAAHAGVSTDSFANSIKFLEKNMAKQDAVGGKALKDFAQLGIEVGGTGEKMKPALEVLAEIADKVRDAKNPADAMGIAMRFLGRQGSEMVPFLKKGGDGIKALLARFQEITGGEGGFEQFAKDAEKAKDAQIDFGLGVDVLRNKLAANLLPVVTVILDKLLWLSVQVRKLTKDTTAFESIIIMLAGTGIATLIYAIGGLVLAAAPWLAAFTAIYIIVDDIYGLFTGADSAIGTFIDAIFGIGAADEMVKKVKESFREFVEFIKEKGPAIKEVWDNTVLPAVKRFFDFVRENKGTVEAFFDKMIEAGHAIAEAFRQITGLSNNEIWNKLTGGGLTKGDKAALGGGIAGVAAPWLGIPDALRGLGAITPGSALLPTAPSSLTPANAFGSGVRANLPIASYPGDIQDSNNSSLSPKQAVAVHFNNTFHIPGTNALDIANAVQEEQQKELNRKAMENALRGVVKP